MNRKIFGIVVSGILCMGAGAISATASPNVAQVSNDRSSVKADSTKLADDEKEVKRLDTAYNEARAKTAEARKTLTAKTTARVAAVKQYGAKDQRSQQAYKDEADAKQNWETLLKQQEDLGNQRKAAIEKEHADNQARGKDVRKLESDESQKKSTAAPK